MQPASHEASSFEIPKITSSAASGSLCAVAKKFTNLWLSFLTAVFGYSGRIFHLELGE
jgi:hypothetical protein